MVELDSMYPDSEEIQDAFNREMAVLKNSLDNLDQLFKRILESKQYITEDVVAEILHCKTTEIPAALTKFRPSRACYLYRLDELYQFIESKRLGKK